MADGFCAEVLQDSLSTPRGLAYDPRDGGLLVVERGDARVTLLSFADRGETKKTTIASAPGLNHGIALVGSSLYASSDTTVFRWTYDVPGAEARDRTEVVIGISADGRGGAPGGHTTRTLAFDDRGRAFVSVGSAGNVDDDSYRSRVRACGDLSTRGAPVDFDDCDVYADGLRNEVGLGFDARGRLWGVENSADRLVRSDLGGDIHEDNPAEELNLLVNGSFYGYPYCWTEGALFDAPGEQWAWPSTMHEKDDAWCRTHSTPPALALQAHSAPLGIVFYARNAAAADCAGAFPADADGDAFVAYHGSWNRDVPTGYKVVRIHFDDDGTPDGRVSDVLAHDGHGAKWPTGRRPVDAVFDGCGRLVVSDDGSGSVFRISAAAPPWTPSPSGAPASTPGREEADAASRATPSRLFAALRSMMLSALGGLSGRSDL